MIESHNQTKKEPNNISRFLSVVLVANLILISPIKAQAKSAAPEPALASSAKEARELRYWRPSISNFVLNEESEGESLSEAEAQRREMAMIGEALANPLSNLWLGFTQNDTMFYRGDVLDALGEDTKVQNSFLINPVLSIQLTEKWKMVFRPVIPVNSFETINNITVDPPGFEGTPTIGTNFERETGLGDIVLWTAFSKQYKPPFIFGFGPTLMLNTASKSSLGTGKNAAGPMLLAFNLSEKWIIGGIAQHWWSFSGEDTANFKVNGQKFKRDRADVSLTDFQPVIRYRLSQTTNIGMAPNWRYNWETDQASIPVGIGFDTMVKIGRLPVKVGLEAYYYVEKSDEFAPDWQLRFLFIPVFPSPDWSKLPLF